MGNSKQRPVFTTLSFNKVKILDSNSERKGKEYEIIEKSIIIICIQK